MLLGVPMLAELVAKLSAQRVAYIAIVAVVARKDAQIVAYIEYTVRIRNRKDAFRLISL